MATTIFSNKNTAHHYDLIMKVEAGIVLEGWEVKSLKSGHQNMKNAYVKSLPSGDLVLSGAKISGYKYAAPVSVLQESRDRTLLVKKEEAARIISIGKRPGYTIIPLEGYVNDRGLIKLVIAVVKGKKKFETKQAIKQKDLARQLRRELKELK